MSDPAGADGAVPGAGRGSVAQSYKRDFWIKENLKHTPPHYRLQKTARLVNRVAPAGECDLLDIGCGPATLMHLLRNGINYYGIDIAVQHPAPNLIEADILESPIRFGDRRFEVIVAQGVFEYVGDFQSRKLAEIAQLLTDNGTFIVTYTNFGHRGKHIFEAFSNVRPMDDFAADVRRHFAVRQAFPTSHNWKGGQPRRGLVKAANMHMNLNVPVISPRLAVEYFFVCSPRRPGRAGTDTPGGMR
jgi:SAM-dependent methyltransferase